MADWYQLWLADKKKRDQQATAQPSSPNPKTYKPTSNFDFHQASLANNVQYTLPGFTGRSGNDGVNSKWEQDMLRPLSIKKYGRSYADKFTNLTKSLGMSDSQAIDFRRFLDSQEASGQTYNLKKDGTPDNRHTVYAGQGMMTKADQIDGILKNMSNPKTFTNEMNAITNLKAMPVPKQPTQSQQPQDVKNHSWVYDHILNPVNNAVGGAVDYLERAGASGVDALTAGQFKKHINDQSAQKALGKSAQQFAASQVSDPTNVGQQAADVVGNLYATAPLFMGMGKAVDPLAKLLTANKYGQAAIRGGLSMGALSAGQNAVDAAVNKDLNLKQRGINVGLNTALGSAADMGLTALGPVAKRIIGKLMKGKTVSQVAKEEGVPEEHVQKVVNDYSNVLADPKPNIPNPIEKPLNINVQPKTPTMNDFNLNPNDIPSVNVPPAGHDLFNFVQNDVKPRGAVPKGNVPTYTKEMLQQRADEILQKVVSPKSYKPIGYHQDLWNQVAEHNGPIHPEQIQQILDHADLLSKDMTQKEQDFVHQYVQDRLSNIAANDGHVAALAHKGDLTPEDMKILMDTANKHETNLNAITQQAADYAQNHPKYQQAAQKLIDNAGQTTQWEATKQLKQDYKNLRDSLDGINFTSSDKANFGDIPQVFKTTQGGIDISKATEILGFKNPEETVNYLQKLAEANRTKMSDLITDPKLGTKTATEAQMKKLNSLEKILQSEYRKNAGVKDIKTQMQQVLDLISKGKGSNTFHAEAQQAFQDTPYFKSIQPLMDGMQHDLSKLQNPTKEDIYQALRKHDDPKTLTELLDLATKDMDAAQKTHLFDALNSDPRIKKLIREMSPKKAETPIPTNNVPKAQGIDELLSMLNGVKPGDRSFLNIKPKSNQTVDEILSSLKNKKPKETPIPISQKPKAPTINTVKLPDGRQIGDLNDQELKGVLQHLVNKKQDLVNGGYDTTRSDYQNQFNSLNKDIQNLKEYMKARKGETVAPKSENSVPKTENVNNSQNKDPLLRLNLQHFEDTNVPPMFTTDKPLESKTAIDALPWYKRLVHKHIEQYMNSTHSANIAERQVLEQSIKDAEKAGNTDLAKAYKAQLKNVKKHGSSFEWAMANEKTAGHMTRNFLEKHFENLKNALGSTKEADMAEALRYQFARNIDWIWKNVNPDYEVGGGWDKEHVLNIINNGNVNSKLDMKGFTKAMRNLTQEWRDEALKANLITKAQHEALSKNPYYIPMSRDVTSGMDNIAKSLKGGTTSNKTRSGLYFVHPLKGGDAEAMYKNPMETIIKNSFSLFQNVAKNDTGREALRLAQLDKKGMFFKEVGKKAFESDGGIAVHTSQGVRYVQMQEDLMKMYKENDLPMDLNVLGKLTSLFAGAKVRSLQYQFTGVPRDLAEGYLKGQINNPIKYLKELILAAKNHDAKEVGAVFEHAYNDGMGGINQEKLLKEFAKQNGNVKNFNPKSKDSWRELVGTLGRIADMPFKPAKWLGQMSDELPRSVEVKVTKEKFMKQNGKRIGEIRNELNDINQQLDHASQATDPFDPALKGIDELHARKTELEDELNNFDRALKREQTYRGRDIMNFGQIGRAGIAKHIKQYAAFANTGTQSKYKLVRAFIERPIATTVKAALLTAPLVYAEKVMKQNLTGNDKDIYDNTPDYIKQYNYVYVNNGKVYTLPKIQELALVTDPIEAMLTGDKSALNSSARNAVKESVPYQAGHFLQGVVPGMDGKISRSNFNSPLASTAFEPVTDIAANSKVGFNHNPIAYADMFGRKNPKANKWTLDLYKGALGNKPSADYAQYAVEQYGGDAGKYLEYLLNMAKKPSDKARIDAALQAINPAQDRAYGNIQVAGHQIFKSPYKKSKVTKK